MGQQAILGHGDHISRNTRTRLPPEDRHDRVGRTTTAPLHFADQSLPVTDSIITLSKSAALTAELPVPSMSA
jgi:hypothetical protein